MKRFKAAAILAAACMLGATACGNGEKITEEAPMGYGNSVKSVEWLGMVTGADSPSKTEEYAVGGTDLGFPVYSAKSGRMYLAFGDTFTDAKSQSGLWRSNVLGYSTDFHLSNGFRLDGFISNGKNASSMIEGHHIDKYEMTKIPTGGIEIGGVLYMFYFSKYSWECDPRFSMNYGGAIKSEDGGNTWVRINDLSWLDDSVPERKAQIEKLANEDICGNPTEAKIAVETHAGYSFTQIFPVDGKDGYVYLFGEGGYRSGGIRLGRVAYEKIESFSEYEYFNGTNGSGDSVWLKGEEGIKAVEANKKSYIVSDICSEQSVMYNAYLKKWMVVYLRNRKDGIVFRTADKIYGPYSEAELLVPYDYPFGNGEHSIYGGLVHEKYTEDMGKIFYLFLSQWMPVYNVSMMRITLK